MNGLESSHLSPEDYAEFIEDYREGEVSAELERHLTWCHDCLDVFGLIMLAERPATAEEEAILDELPEVTAEDLRERLRPRIALSGRLTFIEDDLDPVWLEVVWEHLDGCEACVHYLAEVLGAGSRRPSGALQRKPDSPGSWPGRWAPSLMKRREKRGAASR